MADRGNEPTHYTTPRARAVVSAELVEPRLFFFFLLLKTLNDIFNSHAASRVSSLFTCRETIHYCVCACVCVRTSLRRCSFPPSFIFLHQTHLIAILYLVLILILPHLVSCLLADRGRILPSVSAAWLPSACLNDDASAPPSRVPGSSRRLLLAGWPGCGRAVRPPLF